ncbi:hypothetical protein SLS62_004518 [Diatrype stigma]|uniref:HMG box domain-containing protein n=1 Tax=Diatrype stigma TaxID=117547 RepID=A0AAN9V4P9_9PEZI
MVNYKSDLSCLPTFPMLILQQPVDDVMANEETTANPPSILPPTVEEAYRRKCVQLKQRTKEIEEENDAYRLRLARLKRQIQKSRLERAFLLEQISRRTSTNVEDSEGSPSPPPTPQDKPLRTKRAHRKPSLLPTEGSNPNATFISQNLNTLSPSSDAFSHSQLDSQRDRDHHHHGGGRGGGGASNGVAKPSKRPSNAFEIYCKDMRPVLQAKHKDQIAAGEFRLEEELARGWKDLPESEKEEFKTRFEQELYNWREEREAIKRSNKEAAARDRSRGRDSNFGASSRRAHGGGRSEAASRSARFEDSIQGDDDDNDNDIEMAEADLPSGRGASAAADPDQYETEVEDDNDGPVDD